MTREYTEEIDGELEQLERPYWKAKKSGMFFWHDESEQLSNTYSTLQEAMADCSRYCREVLGT